MYDHGGGIAVWTNKTAHNHNWSWTAIHKNNSLQTQMFWKINKIYINEGICDNGQNFKATIKAAIIYTTEELTNNSTMSVYDSVTTKNPSARNPLRKLS